MVNLSLADALLAFACAMLPSSGSIVPEITEQKVAAWNGIAGTAYTIDDVNSNPGPLCTVVAGAIIRDLLVSAGYQ